jgi:peptidoglycan/LPS O-acetylase OafA/YrhL
MNSLIKQNNTRIFGLDFIKALAILLVLLSHSNYLIDSSNALLISLSGLFSFIGIELFIGLSGFLIGTLLLKQFVLDTFSLKKIFVFFKTRGMRILPKYYFILIINIGIAFFLEYPLQNFHLYFFFFQNFSTYHITFFSESWIFTIEQFTYTLFPLSLLLILNIKEEYSKKWLFLFNVMFLIVLAHILRYFNMKNEDIVSMEIWDKKIYSLVIYHFDAILFGVLLSWVYHFYMGFLKKYRVYFLIIGMHLFFIQFVLLNVLGVDIVSCPIYFNVFYFTLSSTIFCLALPCFVFWKTSSTIFSKLVCFISKASYTAYLIHFSIVAVLIKYFLSQVNYAMSSIEILILYLAVTFAFSYLMNRIFQKI